MTTYPLFALQDLIHVHYGKGLKTTERDESGQYQVYGSSGAVGRHSSALVEYETIIIGRKGSVGEVTYSPEGGWPIDTTFYTEVLDPDRLDLRFLYYALRGARLDKHTITTSIPGVNRGDIYRTKIPLPPLSEQRRIATILDKGDAIRRKRQEAIRLIKEFLRSVFLEIVGPGALDHEEWPEATIESLALNKQDSIRTGPFGSDLRHSEFVDKGIAVLGIDNAVKNHFDWGERRFITMEKYEKLKRYKVFPGDVIITIMGTTGRSAVIPDDIPPAITTKHLAVITLNRELAHPEFIAYGIHVHPEVLHQIERAQRGAIMSGLNLTLIKELRLRIPPLPKQEHFTSIVQEVRKTRDKLSKANEQEVDDLFNSLVQRAFRGELATSEAELARREGRPYEPTSILLDKIKTQKVNVKLRGKHKRQKGK